MLILRERLFRGEDGFSKLIQAIQRVFGLTAASDLLNRKTLLERTSLECMKLMEMNELDNGKYISHWTDKAVEGLEAASKFYKPQTIASIPTVDRFEELTGQFGANGVKFLKEEYKTPEGFIESVRERMLTETKKESPKYGKWFNAHGVHVSNQEFRKFMKLTALRMSGQLTESDSDDYWEKSTSKIVARTKVDQNQDLKLEREDKKAIIHQVLSGFTGIDYKAD